jgi:hypothetical protein
MGERGYLETPASSGGQTLPENNAATVAEVTIAAGVVAIALSLKAAGRASFQAAGTSASGAGKNAVEGTAYFDVPADTPLELPCIGASGRGESLYLCTDTTSASTYSFGYVHGGEM